jgi:hypothetical protein
MKRVLACLIAMTAAASADEVTLKSGAKIKGIIKKTDDPSRVVVEVGVGTVSFPRSEVLSTEEGRTPLHDYYEKWETVKESKKVEDYLDLAKFAKDNGLPRFLKGLYEMVLRLDGDNETARKYLGYTKYQGRWLTREEMNRAKGLVEFEGRWITTAEREIILSQRLEARMRREEELAERRRKAEEERKAREEAAAEARMTGYYYRPSEFWPYYYRGPRRTYRHYGPFGPYEGLPTFDIFDVIGNPFTPGGPGNVKKK